MQSLKLLILRMINSVNTWEILFESTDLKDGGDEEERPDIVPLETSIDEDGKLRFKVPERGQYRLFVYANDGLDHSATANIPFLVE